MNIIRDLWLCDDCISPAANGDFTGLGHHYSEDEAAHRMEVIERGLDDLPGLVPDEGDDQMECRECGHIQDRDSFLIRVEREGTDEEESFRVCPVCHSLDTKARESGIDSFSWSRCDCCDSRFGGSRMRFAQLIRESDPYQLTLPFLAEQEPT